MDKIMPQYVISVTKNCLNFLCSTIQHTRDVVRSRPGPPENLRAHLQDYRPILTNFSIKTHANLQLVIFHFEVLILDDCIIKY